MYDQNRDSVSGTETKVQFQYQSQKKISKTETNVSNFMEVFISLKINQDLQK